jgi:SH3 domain protein
MRCTLVLACLALSPWTCLRAETAYVTDMLRLGIHHAQDTSDPAFRNLVSGTELEILERVPNYARVRTPEGEEGWVKSAYLVTEKPARAQILELESRLEETTGQLGETRAALSTAQSEADRLAREAANTNSSTEAIADTLERLKRENETYEAQLERYRRSVPLLWAGGALLVTFVGGFVGGLWWLDAVIRRRHGGFRIY